MSKTQNFDAVIIGGGLAGLALVCLLGKAGVKTACLERQAFNTKSADLRTTAISYGSRTILQDAGIWDDLEAKACAINDIEILDGDSPVLLDFSSNEVEGKSFGWIVLNNDLRAALLQKAKTQKTVTLITPAEVQNFEANEKNMCITLKDGSTLTAQLMIGADGRGSFVRDEMDVHTRRWDYQQRAVVFTVTHQNPHHNIAVEHFWPEGPFAILPMQDDENGNHRSAVVWTEHGPERRSRMNLSDTDFENLMAEKFPARYGTVKMAGPRASHPLSLVHAAEYIAPRTALVADAAHGIHPIAGQGLNLGYRDVKTLADLVTQAFKAGQDIGSQEILNEYQILRRIDNTGMVAFTDGLVRLFSNNIGPVRLLRRAGLKIVGKLPPAKQFFMRQAMGEKAFRGRQKPVD